DRRRRTRGRGTGAAGRSARLRTRHRMSLRRLAARLVATAAAASGWLRMARRRRHRRGDFRLYILEYHDVDPEREFEGTVSAQRFQNHLRHLGRRYRTVTLADAVEHLRAGELGQDLIVITFDDGYAGNYEAAWPVLRDENLPATIFLTSGFLDGNPLWFDTARRSLAALRQGCPEVDHARQTILRSALGTWPLAASDLDPAGINRLMRSLKYQPPARRRAALEALIELELERAPAARPMSWQQVGEMQAGGIEFGAHTVTHPILSTLEPDAQEDEIVRSRQRIADATGIEPTSFAYPNGSARDYDQHTVEILDRCGFAAACTTRRGSNAPGCAPLTLRRLGIGSDPLTLLDARLGGLFDEDMRARFRAQ
ncbi:MAG: polysaccharide deacetylase family protein, partial [Acidobacteriota bacterium]